MSEFVFFKLPNQTEISFWKGNFKEFDFGLPKIENDVFLLGEFNAGKSNIGLVPISKNRFDSKRNFQLEFCFNKNSIADTQQLDYIDIVKKVQLEMSKTTELKKVVLARTKLVTEEIDLLESFYKLCDSFPHSMVYLASSIKHGTWLGASPEVFLTIKENTFETYALAGTKTAAQSWTNKEVEEQNWVSVYIENILNDLKILYKKSELETVQSGEIQHLKNSFIGTVKNLSDYKNLFEALNPTPAVGGLEKSIAIKLIQLLEKNNRHLYSGIVGPLFKDSSANLFVNLRCLQAFSGAYCLYAGAGITADSIPENEWLETERKIQNTQKHLQVKDSPLKVTKTE
jgi:isochorismate synthase